MKKGFNKHGAMSEHVPEILLILAVLVIILLAVFIISGKWGSLVDAIKSIFRFGK